MPTIKAVIKVINGGKALRFTMNDIANSPEVDHEKFVVATSDINRVYLNIDPETPAERFVTIVYGDGQIFDTNIDVIGEGEFGLIDTTFNTNEELYNWLEDKVGTSD